MTAPKWFVHLLTIWVLFWGSILSSGLSRILTGFPVGGIILPLGFLPFAGLVWAGFILIKKKRGARIIATVVLGWMTFGFAKIIILRMVGNWPHDYTISNQLYLSVLVLFNVYCLAYLWWNRQGNPYGSAAVNGGSKPLYSYSDLPPAKVDLSSFDQSHNEASFHLYRQLAKKGENLFFSPFSLRAALAMAYSGARGETADQIGKALGFPSTGEVLHGGFSELIQRLNEGNEKEYDITVANSLWGQDGKPIRADFLYLIKRSYDSEIYQVDFRNDTETARLTINRWVENKTNQKILELIPSGGLSPEAGLVLANAVHFFGSWVHKFIEGVTRDRTFYREHRGQVETPIMITGGNLPYYRGHGLQAVDLGYLGGDLSFLVLLPDENNNLRNLEMAVNGQMLSECVDGLEEKDIMLHIPRFKLKWGTFDLKDKFENLGMKLAFIPLEADFSGINGIPPPDEESLYLSSVYHQAEVEVNEEGTEAAAATAGPMLIGSAEVSPLPPAVIADHPFLFAIRERKTGAILFLGRVADPSRQS